MSHIYTLQYCIWVSEPSASFMSNFDRNEDLSLNLHMSSSLVSLSPSSSSFSSFHIFVTSSTDVVGDKGDYWGIIALLQQLTLDASLLPQPSPSSSSSMINDDNSSSPSSSITVLLCCSSLHWMHRILENLFVCFSLVSFSFKPSFRKEQTTWKDEQECVVGNTIMRPNISKYFQYFQIFANADLWTC